MSDKTDMIRAMLREQKRSCAELHAHPLFGEMRRAAASEERRGKQHGPPGDEDPPRPAIDDLDAGGTTLEAPERGAEEPRPRGRLAARAQRRARAFALHAAAARVLEPTRQP